MPDEYAQDRYSPYAAMGNEPEVMIDPNGTTFYVSGDPSTYTDLLDEMYGEGNYKVSAGGIVSINTGKQGSAFLNLIAYFMANGGGGMAGGGSAASSAAAFSVAKNVLDATIGLSKNARLYASADGSFSFQTDYDDNGTLSYLKILGFRKSEKEESNGFFN